MALSIETYSNIKGGNSVFKAVSHPLAARKARALIDRLAAAGPVALYDPFGFFGSFAEFYDTSRIDIRHVFVQDVTRIGATIAGRTAQPVTELRESGARAVFVAAFDAGRPIAHIRHLLPDGAVVASLDDIRLDDRLLSNRSQYLDPLNFATNFAFFRDDGRTRTRVATANYWAGYGATGAGLHMVLFDANGATLAEWDETLPDGAAAIVIDSRAVRERFGLGPFTGQLFIHAVGIRGHDVVKYALDVWRDDGSELSCTHDANAWPSERYAGLPAPRPGEDVVLWVQNSHPCADPERRGRPQPDGRRPRRLARPRDRAVRHPCGVDVADAAARRALAAADRGPCRQVFRPPALRGDRGHGSARIAHANVERNDLKPDPSIPELGNLMGKAYILPAPVLPTARWRSLASADADGDQPERAAGRRAGDRRLGHARSRATASAGCRATMPPRST